MSDTTWNDSRITAFVLGELSAADRDAFEQELESSDELMAAVEQARGVTDRLAALYSAEHTPPLDVQRREAILASGYGTVALATDQDRQGRSWRIPLTLLATAAIVLLLFGVAPWLNRHETDLTVAQTAPPDVGFVLGESITEMVQADPEMETAAPEYAFGMDRLTDGDAAESDSGSVVDDPISGIKKRSVAADPSPALPAALSTSEMSAAAPSEPLLRSESLIDSAPKPAGSKQERQDADSVVRKKRRLRPQSERASPGDSNISSLQSLLDTDKFFRSNDPPVAMKNKTTSDRKTAQAMTLESASRAGKSAAKDDSGLSRRPPLRDQPAPDSSDVRSSASPARILGSADLMKEEAPAPHPAAASETIGLGGDGLQTADLAIRLEVGKQVALRETKSRLESRLSYGRTTGSSEEKTRRIGGGGGGFGFRGAILAKDPRFGQPNDEGRGPGISGDQFDPITDNPFKRVSEHPLSTFSVDVDTASYSKIRDFLMRGNQLPRRDAVRIEEMVNYFAYDYEPPKADAQHPFAARATITSCPWNSKHRLARIALKGKTMSKDQRPPCNLVFLLDTSGSMNAPNKLPLVKQGMQMLLKQLRSEDRVAITVYAGSAGLVLDSTSAKKGKKIRKALTQLSAGGSTNGGAGISLAYQTARDSFITGGVNRVILCTDGDFNVGTTGTDQLVRLVEEEAKGGIYLSVLGFGMGNHNDAMLEKISGRGNGNYAFIDSQNEARKVLVDQTSGTLVTIAKNVKMQVEFNPAHVSSYRLIGYENRILAKEDFNDDKKDAGEIGAGHAVTAFYELVPVDVEADASVVEVDDLKYQTKPEQTSAADSEETMTLKLRYLEPDAIVERGDKSTLVEIPIRDDGDKFSDADSEFRFAAAVAGFGMQLRRSPYAGSWTLSDVQQIAQASAGKDLYELRAEFVDLVRKASELMGEE